MRHAVEHRRAPDTAIRLALRIVAFGLGVFFLAMSLNKIAWFGDPDVLAQRFQRWLPMASPYARIVPVAEFCTAMAMLSGVFTNVAAGAALFMILNFHLATSAFSSPEFLRDGTGPPMIAALIALALAGRDLPFSARASKRREQ